MRVNDKGTENSGLKINDIKSPDFKGKLIKSSKFNGPLYEVKKEKGE